MSLIVGNPHNNPIDARTRGPLDYNGAAIRDKGEMLSLTDMWRAAGSLDSKRPANWARKEGGGIYRTCFDDFGYACGAHPNPKGRARHWGFHLRARADRHFLRQIPVTRIAYVVNSVA